MNMHWALQPVSDQLCTCTRSHVHQRCSSCTAYRTHPCACMHVRAVRTRMHHACHRLCCSFSPSWKIGYGENGELRLLFLFVLRVCTMDLHVRNCCGLGRDVTWRFRLSGWCAMCFGSARSRYPRITDLEKVIFAIFKFAEGLPVVRFQNRKVHTWLEVQAKLL